MSVYREDGNGWTSYRARWTDSDGAIVLGPPRPTFEEAERDARRMQPPEPIVSRTPARWWG